MRVEQIEERLRKLNEAYDKVLNAEEYATADGRRVQRAKLDTISDEIERWERKLVKAKAGGGIMAKRVIPHGL